jgi:cytochrome c-type biogenesis protein CcmH/NrfG
MKKIKEAKCFIKTVMLEKFPNNEHNYYLLGLCEAREENFDEATKNFYMSLELNPANLEVRIALGKLFLLQRDV